ncbi:SAM-dependent methyltransferase [Allocatelliglobosispora scoriae]|uniref:SAM-dependent methyltransferase n=1 Tax=Allocatelliglobosispora scoriae TaxID=643052 RepID=A0A841BUH7_9ACTN|nr:class I SAM-dependent methyltransferase [Allocatelliglobosispora scoriae]MBB5872767.1 SAM-dependent methyltransferase [Allocatelliglobosispora scoriae]
MTSPRERSLVFGEVAEAYDEVRLGYPVEIAELITAYAGRVPERVAEAGAGTGKGSATLRTLGVPMTCIEPDPAMAAVLARRFTGDELVSVVVSRFEEWAPPAGGVGLVASATAWHWVDRERRTRLAYDALAPGGVLAVFAHQHGFADDEVAEALNAVYLRHAPAIAERPGSHVHPPAAFHSEELRGSPLFGDVAQELLVTVVPFPTARYLALLSTFSPHRLLPEEQRATLHAALAAVIDERGGVLEQMVTTELWLARRDS